MLPNFLVIGAEKCATTWLHHTLRQNPSVFMPDMKEIHFFNSYSSNLSPRDLYERLGLDWYANVFSTWQGEPAVGEATPMYICDPEAPGRIHRHLPDVRLVACLRNPADRAYSHHRMAMAKGHPSDSLADLVRSDDRRFIQRGDYADQLLQYLELFPREQLHVIIFEELFLDPATHLSRLAEFLGVPGHWHTTEPAQERVFAATGYRSRAVQRLITQGAFWMRTHRGPDRVLDAVKSLGLAGAIRRANKRPQPPSEMDADTRTALTLRYEPGIRRLEQLLDRQLPWLRADEAQGAL